MVGVSVGSDRPMPADGAVQIAFDRYLLPSTVNRQSIIVVDGANQPLPPELTPLVLYDPIARTVTLAPPRQPWLAEGQIYKLLLGIPEGDADTGGLRAVDRATLDPAAQRQYAFAVGPKSGAPFEPPVSFCRDVLPVFAAKCSAPTCHGSYDAAAAGLRLTTSTDVARTALGRVAQGANLGPHANLVTTSERRFGVDMPLVDPGSPGNSWLLYKVEIAPLPAPVPNPRPVTCEAARSEAPASPFAPLVPGAAGPASEAERGVLSDHVQGQPMPYPVLAPAAYRDAALTWDEREKLRMWIQQLPTGGSVPECGACGTAP
ncbi:MAG: hypothetical protein JWP97_6144 [Labilithrix sp.]|nr:hypothetical protein [Labilithrix sp.]